MLGRKYTEDERELSRRMIKHYESFARTGSVPIFKMRSITISHLFQLVVHRNFPANRSDYTLNSLADIFCFPTYRGWWDAMNWKKKLFPELAVPSKDSENKFWGKLMVCTIEPGHRDTWHNYTHLYGWAKKVLTIWFDTGCSLNIVFLEDFKIFRTLAFLCFPSVSVCVHTLGRKNTSAAAELAEFRRITKF